jgi:hypothetical protein
VLNSISSQKDFDGKTVFFWHKNIDEVVAHQLKLEIMQDFNFAIKYDHIDVVFGGDHSVQCFRAVVQLIF